MQRMLLFRVEGVGGSPLAYPRSPLLRSKETTAASYHRFGTSVSSEWQSGWFGPEEEVERCSSSWRFAFFKEAISDTFSETES
jgi:hypothetical protein